MNYANPQIRRIARRIPIFCASYFMLFAFGSLYLLQRDVLAQVQFRMSEGVTVYHPLLSALLCTLLLTFLGGFAGSVLRWLPLRMKALAWFFPFLLLGALSHWHFPQFGDAGTPPRWGTVILFVVLYAFSLLLSRRFPDSSKEKDGFVTYAWANILLLILFTVMSLSLSNTDVVLHRTLRAGRLVEERDYNGVLQAGKYERHPSQPLSAAVALALSQTGQLGERLFSYPQPYGSEGLVPRLADTLMVYNLPRESGFHLGYKRGGRTPVTLFLEVISSRPNSRPAVRDYLLCAHLLDKNLDRFAETLLVGDTLPDTLPLHYREALLLRQHLNPDAPVLLADAPLSAELEEFLVLLQTAGTKDEREFMVHERFGTTYWCYFYYN